MDTCAKQEAATTSHNPVRDDDKPEECKVCFNMFDETDRRPRNLPCGHTFCSICVGGLIVSSRLTCPCCRKKHSAMNVHQFPVSYITEVLLRKLQANQRTAEKETIEFPKAAGRPSQSYQDLSKKFQSVIKEQKSIINGCLASSQEVQSSLDEYLAQLRDWKAQDKLDGSRDQNEATVTLLEEEEASVRDMKNVGKEGNEQLEGHLKQLEAVHALIDQIDHCNAEAEDWTHTCRRFFPGVNTDHTSQEVPRVTRRCPEGGTTEAGATANPGTSKKVIGDSSVEKSGLTVEELCKMSERALVMVKNGEVWAFKQINEKKYYSKITLENDQLHLSRLTGDAPTGDSVLLQHIEVVNALKPRYHQLLVFLELSLPWSLQERVLIQLDSRLPFSKELYKLFAGEEGTTFTSIKNSVHRRNVKGESIKVLALPKLVHDEGLTSNREGAVFVKNSGGNSYVHITTRGDVTYLSVFGYVMSGLGIVKKAAGADCTCVSDFGIAFRL